MINETKSTITTMKPKGTNMQHKLMNTQATETQMFSEVRVITPVAAKHLLEKNHEGNRVFNKGTVEKYASAMRSGNWSLSPQGLVIDGNSGEVVDGQHRLAAICLTGITISMYITYVTDPQTFKYLDQGKNRSFSDLSGVPKKVVTIVSRTLRLSETGKKDSAYVEVEPYIYGRLGEEAARFYENVKPSGYMWNNAVLKSMAVCSIIAGNLPRQEVYDIYNAFLFLNTSNMTPCRSNFLRQVMKRDVLGAMPSDKAIISKAQIVFSREGNVSQICRYSNASYIRGVKTLRVAVELGKS